MKYELQISYINITLITAIIMVAVALRQTDLQLPTLQTLDHLIKWIKSGVNSDIIFFYQVTHTSDHTKIEGKRSRGRQRKRWIDNVTADIIERGSCMQMAKELVHNREEWSSFTIQPHRRQPPGE